MTSARIVGSVAVDVVRGDPAAHFAPAIAAQFVAVPDHVEVGWVLLQNISGTALADGESWHPPRTWIEQYLPGAYRYAQRAAAPAPVYGLPPPTRHITGLAFRNRFTFSEKVALELASADNPAAATNVRQAAAALRAYLEDAKAATYIDLDRDDTRAGVTQLQTQGLIAPGRAAEILDAPVQQHEAYQGRQA